GIRGRGARGVGGAAGERCRQRRGPRGLYSVARDECPLESFRAARAITDQPVADRLLREKAAGVIHDLRFLRLFNSLAVQSAARLDFATAERGAWRPGRYQS